MLLIDWHHTESHVFINPRLPQSIKRALQEAVRPHENLKGHIWLASSGTENFPKMIALSKNAMLASAAAVNAHLALEKHHSWLNVLPLFHVGGLAIHARAFLSQAPLYDFSQEKWEPIEYVKRLEALKISYSSLTPTHIYDIVTLGIAAPSGLKGIVVGGGALAPELHAKGYELGWPLLKSYGMTELCSQVATALCPEPKANLVLLKHIALKSNAAGYLEIKSPALFTGFVHGNDALKEFITPLTNGWYTTQDKGCMQAGHLQIAGRGSHFLKIGGENVNLSQLEALWEDIKIRNRYLGEAVLIDLPHDRLGKMICLAIVSQEPSTYHKLVEEFQHQVIPLAKIQSIYKLEAIPRTALHKIKQEELRKICLQKSEHFS